MLNNLSRNFSNFSVDGTGWVTGSEDKTVKIWSTSGEIQSLTLPCSSVWGVAVLPNSDIVAASE